MDAEGWAPGRRRLRRDGARSRSVSVCPPVHRRGPRLDGRTTDMSASAARLHAQDNRGVLTDGGPHPFRIAYLAYRTNVPARLNSRAIRRSAYHGYSRVKLVATVPAIRICVRFDRESLDGTRNGP